MVLVAGGVALYFFNHPPARELTGNETEARDRLDWKGIASTLGVEGSKAERACKSPAYLALAVTVGEEGRLRDVELLNYPHEPTRACIERELSKVKFPRKGLGAVRVAVTLQN